MPTISEDLVGEKSAEKLKICRVCDKEIGSTFMCNQCICHRRSMKLIKKYGRGCRLCRECGWVLGVNKMCGSCVNMNDADGFLCQFCFHLLGTNPDCGCYEPPTRKEEIWKWIYRKLGILCREDR